LGGERFERTINRGCPRAESARDRAEIEASAGAHQLAAPGEARQGLVHRGAISEVQQALGGHGRSFGHSPLRLRQDLFTEPLHRRISMGSLLGFLTLHNDRSRLITQGRAADAGTSTLKPIDNDIAL